MHLVTSPRITSCCPPCVSEDGKFLALVTETHLVVYRQFRIVHKIPFAGVVSRLKWAPRIGSEMPQRLLAMDEDNIHVWDLHDYEWKVTLCNISKSLGKVAFVNFGWTQDEVLVMSEVGSKILLWSLKTGHKLEIRDPKLHCGGLEHRPRTGHFAVLSRIGQQDVLTIYSPNSYDVVESVDLPTIDAQGFKWSPDGKWIVVWEAPSVCKKAYIYTADGNLYRTYLDDNAETSCKLGIKCIGWSPDSEYLAIGGFNGVAVILSSRTFHPIVSLAHTTTFQQSEHSASWREHTTNGKKFYKLLMPLQAHLPSQDVSDDGSLRVGVSIVEFNSSGSLLASKDDSSPSVVWIWHMSKLSLRAVVSQLNPIKSLSWHPQEPELLLIRCSQDEPVIYIWCSKEPKAFQIGLEQSTKSADTKWSETHPLNGIGILHIDPTGAMAVWPFASTESIPRDSHEQDDSTDSVFEALTGHAEKKRIAGNTELLLSSIEDDEAEAMNDTFGDCR